MAIACNVITLHSLLQQDAMEIVVVVDSLRRPDRSFPATGGQHEAAASRWLPWLAPLLSIEQVEEGSILAPRFDSEGLIAAVATDATSGEVLMVGTMTAEALIRTIETGEAHYWSRSRQQLWRKGATSGLVQRVVEMRIDDDQDAIWLRVSVSGGASCHVGYRSCFYRALTVGELGDQPLALRFTEPAKVFDPAVLYAGSGNPTRL